MAYLDDVEKELRGLLNSEEPDAETWSEQIVNFIRGKLLESYKNGAQAARKQMQRGGQNQQQQKSKGRAR
jgi:hypothetical protein